MQDVILCNSIRHTADMKSTILLLRAIDRDTVQGRNVPRHGYPLAEHCIIRHAPIRIYIYIYIYQTICHDIVVSLTLYLYVILHAIYILI